MEGSNRLMVGLVEESETADGETLTKAYEYDAAGNRDVMRVSGSENYTTDYDYDLNNRLKTEIKDKGLTIETAEYQYDKNGNQISKTTFFTGNSGGSEEVGIYELGAKLPMPREDYTVELNKFNVFNQLVQVQNDEGTSVYRYKSDGLRISKDVNGKVVNHVWDGDQIVLEFGAVNDVYLRGINLIKSDQQGYYLYNAHGDVVQRTNSSGALIKSYLYDAFGVETDIDEMDTNPFRYCAEYFDIETGSIYLRARFYNPSHGNFMSEDPIRDGLNWYTYCYSNPNSFVDPDGLTPYSREYRYEYGSIFKLHVSPQWADGSMLGTDISNTALGLWGEPGTAIGSLAVTAAKRAAMGVAGLTPIEYSLLNDVGLVNSVVSTTPLLKEGSILSNLSKGLDIAFAANDTISTLDNWLNSHRYRIEEAIFNHFDHDIWTSTSHEVLSSKFQYAMQWMTTEIAKGTIKIRKAGDVFTAHDFNDLTYGGNHAYLYDHLTGEKMFFDQDAYYFFAVDGSIGDYINRVSDAIEKNWP